MMKFNDGLCAPFKVCRGVRQGCSLSGMLYALTIEPLLNKQRADLKGFSIPDCPNAFRLSDYADDVVKMIEEQRDIDTLLNVSKYFEVIASAKINWNKSEALLVGQWSVNMIKFPGGLFWKKKKVLIIWEYTWEMI